MDNIMLLTSNTYVVDDVSTTMKHINLAAADKNATGCVIDNTLGSTPVFVVSADNSKTITYPTQASGPVVGKIIGAGCKESYTKEATHDHFMLIREEGSADVVISIGFGG